MKKISGVLLLLMMTCSSVSQAQVVNAFPGRKTRVLFLLDGSGSMLATMGNTNRWSASITIMSQIVDTLRGVENLELGLRVFGHTKPNVAQDCNDTKLEVPFAPNNHKAMITKLRSVKPLGYTSITQSLLASAKDFPEDKTARNIIVIITDGVEECNGDPCAVSQELQKKGIMLRPFIIGIGSDDEKFRLAYSCAGRYYNAQSQDELQKVIGVIINQALNNTSAQVNLLDATGMPRETNVPMTIYDAQSGEIVENLVHTMNGKGVPDTLYLDPVRKYRVVAHTLPKVEKTDIEIIPGRHNTIALETPQGDLFLKMGGITKYGRLQSIVRENGSMNTLNAQDFNTSTKYITGTYDLEILTTPRIMMKAIPIEQNKTFTVEIPTPGQLQVTLSKDIVASIFVVRNNQMEWVKDLDDNQTAQNFPIQPGDYKLVYRPKSETRTMYTKTKEFKIISGSNTIITL
jgi:Ca-activated chloride channel family protein